MNQLERNKAMDKIKKVLRHFDIWPTHRKLLSDAESAKERWLSNLSVAIAGRKWRKVTEWTMDSSLPGDQLGKDSPPIADLREANIVTSEGATDFQPFHAPVLDIDVPMIAVPSTTYGHHHLYFEVACSTEDYWNLLDALAVCGIVQHEWVDASKNRGYSAVRMPWVEKEQTDEDL